MSSRKNVSSFSPSRVFAVLLAFAMVSLGSFCVARPFAQTTDRGHSPHRATHRGARSRRQVGHRIKRRHHQTSRHHRKAAPSKTNTSTTPAASTTTTSAAGKGTGTTSAAPTPVPSGESVSANFATPGSIHSKRTCLYSASSISALHAAGAMLGINFNCSLVYNDAAQTWSQWDDPWFITSANPDVNWAEWARASPDRTMILSVPLFPSNADSTDWLNSGCCGRL